MNATADILRYKINNFNFLSATNLIVTITCFLYIVKRANTMSVKKSNFCNYPGWFCVHYLYYKHSPSTRVMFICVIMLVVEVGLKIV